MKSPRTVAVAVLLALCTSSSVSSFSIKFGSDVTPLVQEKVMGWSEAAPASFFGERTTFIIGDDPSSSISSSDLSALTSDEGYIVESSPDCRTLSLRGRSPRGNSYASYWLISKLGVSFLHPLSPTVLSRSPLTARSFCDLHLSESPVWPLRGWHYHTQHPLELTEVLNGFDSPDAPFSSMLSSVSLFFEWCLANGVNYVEWMPLYAKEWSAFAEGEERMQRLRSITDLARDLTLETSADVPIALRQQHSWYMISGSPLSKSSWQQEVEDRLDWILGGAGFDHLGTESGSTEFTHTDCATMLSWMNYTAAAAAARGARALIKCHVSDAGTCPEYGDLNFNFLPKLSVESLGVLPHTVQTYGFEDPASGTYGQNNFEHMLQFMVDVAESQPDRLNVYYGETAYWVNYDINVPLFLPLYGDRRISDLRTLKAKEAESGGAIRFDGQNNFASGWEWGYWFGDVLTARAAWSGGAGSSQSDAFRLALGPILDVLAASAPEALREKYESFFSAYVEAQRDLLIYGRSTSDSEAEAESGDGEEFGATYMLNGHAYLAGWEAMADVEFVANQLDLVGANTQPAHVPLRAIMHGVGEEGKKMRDLYTSKVRPLLVKMDEVFSAASLEWELLSAVGAALRGEGEQSLVDEISDSLKMTALRARQVRNSYEAAAHFKFSGRFGAREMLERPHPRAYYKHVEAARAAIDEAVAIVARREAAYRVPAERIGGWRKNPTAYGFTYLWTTKSLIYFWRDYGIVSQASVKSYSPCYLNYQNPVEIGLGTERLQKVAQAFRDHFEGDVPIDFITECLAAPEVELQFPRDL